MHSGVDRRLLSLALASVLALVSCTSTPTTPTPAAKEASPAAKPASSPTPVAASSPPPSAARPPVVGGGAAQPRANPTFASIGGSAAIIVPTPNFNVAATPQPAPLAPAVALQTVQPANVVQVVGTLSRIPTAIPGSGGAGGGPAAGSGAGSGGSGGASGPGGGSGGAAGGAAGALLTIGAVVTSTPLVRVQPQPQPTIAFPR